MGLDNLVSLTVLGVICVHGLVDDDLQTMRFFPATLSAAIFMKVQPCDTCVIPQSVNERRQDDELHRRVCVYIYTQFL
jgi:hypothetical protein